MVEILVSFWVLLGWPIFRGHVSFRECIQIHLPSLWALDCLWGHPCVVVTVIVLSCLLALVTRHPPVNYKDTRSEVQWQKYKHNPLSPLCYCTSWVDRCPQPLNQTHTLCTPLNLGPSAVGNRFPRILDRSVTVLATSLQLANNTQRNIGGSTDLRESHSDIVSMSIWSMGCAHSYSC